MARTKQTARREPKGKLPRKSHAKQQAKQSLTSNTVESADDLMEKLATISEQSDFDEELYAKVVNDNEHLIGELHPSFWPETFSGDNDKEMLFWINYPNRFPTFMELSIIKPIYEKLVDIGLFVAKSNQTLDEENFEESTEILRDRIDDLTEQNDNINLFIIKNRLAKFEKMRSDYLVSKLNKIIKDSNELFIIINGKEITIKNYIKLMTK